MRPYLLKLVCLAAVCCFALPGWAEKLVIYHTSDIHGFYFPRPDKNNRLFGGFAVLENVLRGEKEPFVLLDSGDFSSGNKEANDSNGLYSVELMNAAGKSGRNVLGRGYAAQTIGNHDSDFGAEILGSTLSSFNGDVLAANMHGLPMKNKTVLPFRVYTWNGRRIAVIGYALDGPGMAGEMEISALDKAGWEQLLAEVYAQKPDAVVLLAHDSIADARKASQILSALAPALTQNRKIDVFLGGHAHVRNMERRLGENGPLFVESGAMLEGTTRVELDFNDQTGALESVSARYIRLDPETWGEEPNTAARLAEIENTSLRQAYAFVPQALPKYPRGSDAEADLPKMLADEMFDWLSAREKVDFTVFQIPAIRKDVAPGVLTGRDLVELLPYTEYVATFDIPGKKLKQAVRETIRREKERGDYSIFAYSKNVYVEYKYRPGKKNPVKITKFLVNGKKLSNRKIYRAGAISHIPDGYFEGAPFKGYARPNKKVYRDQCSSGLLFSVVNALPGDTPAEKRLLAPADIRMPRQSR